MLSRGNSRECSYGGENDEGLLRGNFLIIMLGQLLTHERLILADYKITVWPVVLLSDYRFVFKYW